MSAFYPVSPNAPGSGKKLEVICAGLPRCATNSLKHALQYLGYPTCHMMDIIWWPDRQRQAIALYREQNDRARQAKLQKLFEGFSACCDAPGTSFVDDLMDMYPDAKIVLNQRRDPKTWARSFDEGIMFFCGWGYWFFGLLMTLDRLHCEFTTLYVNQLRGRFGLQGRRDWLEDAYVLHNQWVRDEAAKRGRPVLEWTPGDGWEPLCESKDPMVETAPGQDEPTPYAHILRKQRL
ncbi:hypothetical protein F4809DRAFT_647566 [Biscogniauxia mediterranea]|nr:hypothetical protein F4809DRAFT_647566 [Biscogniauxia mediterranea]